jgi:hypothetical protein
MHNIEPFYGWLEDYDSATDENCPFCGEEYSEFYYTKKVYNYYLHPRWDDFGSETLYAKILFADYDEGFCIIELIGEWNDCIDNDFLTLKQNLLMPLLDSEISKFILICENVYNFHGSETDYYQEMQEELYEYDGWICAINCLKHVIEEMKHTGLSPYVNFSQPFDKVNWRPYKPMHILHLIEKLQQKGHLRLE